MRACGAALPASAARCPMLNVFVPQPQGLTRVDVRLAAQRSRARPIWIDLLEPTLEEEKLVEAHARHRRADARGDEGDRDLESALRRQRRAVHDRHGRCAARHRPPGQHRGHLHPGGRQARHQSLPRHQAVPAIHRLCASATRPPARTPCRSWPVSSRPSPSAIADILERVGGDLDGVSGSIFARHGSSTPDQPRPACDDRAHRLQRRAELESAREPGEPRTTADVRAAVGQRRHDTRAARPLSLHQPRRHLALGPREFPRRQGVVPARSDARPDQRRAEQHHQDLLGRRGHVHAADADREHLRHELSLSCPSWPGTLRQLPLLDRADDRLDGSTYAVFKRKGWL